MSTKKNRAIKLAKRIRTDFNVQDGRVLFSFYQRFASLGKNPLLQQLGKAITTMRSNDKEILRYSESKEKVACLIELRDFFASLDESLVKQHLDVLKLEKGEFSEIEVEEIESKYYYDSPF